MQRRLRVVRGARIGGMAKGLSTCSCKASVGIVGNGGLECLLLAEEIAEVGDSVLRIADELRLGLTTVEFFSLDVGQGGGNLTVWVRVSSGGGPGHAAGGAPPSSLAMTSALPSCYVSETFRGLATDAGHSHQR
jgi:hypothetical protein